MLVERKGKGIHTKAARLGGKNNIKSREHMGGLVCSFHKYNGLKTSKSTVYIRLNLKPDLMRRFPKVKSLSSSESWRVGGIHVITESKY